MTIPGDSASERRRLVRERVHSLHIWHTAYDDAASSYCFKGRAYGVLTALCSAVVATAWFTSLTSDTASDRVKIGAGILAAVSAVLATLGATLNYPELAVEYRKRANELGTVRAHAERLLAEDVTKEALEELDTTIAAARDAPQIISDRQYHRAENRVNHVGSRWSRRSARRVANKAAERTHSARTAAEAAARDAAAAKTLAEAAARDAAFARTAAEADARNAAIATTTAEAAARNAEVATTAAVAAARSAASRTALKADASITV